MFKYKQEIFDALITILIHNDKINYSELYRNITLQLNKQISYSDYGTHLNKLLEKNIVKKQ